jgi:hypothetical protein
MAARLQRDNVTFANGDWEISFFYEGVSDLPAAYTDAQWEQRVQALRDWREADTESMTARVAYALGLFNYGWKARGKGFADTVTQDGWRQFSGAIGRGASHPDRGRAARSGFSGLLLDATANCICRWNSTGPVGGAFRAECRRFPWLHAILPGDGQLPPAAMVRCAWRMGGVRSGFRGSCWRRSRRHALRANPLADA